LDLASCARGTQARPGVSKNHASHPAGFPDAVDHTGDCFRSSAPANRRMEPMGPSGNAWRFVSRELYCRAVAFCRFFDVPGFAQLDIRDQQLSLFRSSQVSLGAQLFCSDGTNRRGLLDADGHRAACGGHHDRNRNAVGRLDAANSQVSQSRKYNGAG
jgi:hypothetical protein